MKNFLNGWSKLNKELIAGLTTFFTMSYIVIVNPLIWSSPGSGVSLSFALTATVVLLVLINIIAAIFINLPYAFGPGMGLNAFVVYTVIISQKIPFPTALGVIFWSSILFILISVLPIRKKIIESLPDNMKHAMTCGIGLFLAFIGLKNLNIITASSSTLLQLGHIDIKVVLGCLGFCIAFYLFIKNKPYAFLVSILVVTAISIFTKQTTIPSHLVSLPDVKNIIPQIDIWGALKLSLLPTIVSLLLANLFDSISTIVGLSNASGLHDANGNPVRLKQTLIVDSFGSLLASLVGTSPTVIYVESATGIQAGGRSGVVPLVVALCFLPCLFLEPVIQAIPAFATAPILVFVGLLMSLNLKRVDAKNFDDIIPVFITVLFMPLTSSITYGVIFGILSHVVMKILAGKRKQISATLWILSIISLFVFVSSFTKQNIEQTLKTAQANAQKYSSLSANFTQEYYSALREKTTISKGRLYLKDKLFRWEITEPRNQVYINDGKFIWKYEKEFNHAEQFQKSKANLEFLTVVNNLNTIKQYYDISEGTVSKDKNQILNLVLTPKPNADDQRTLHVSIEVKTGYIKNLNMLDENGNKTNITLNDFSTKPIENSLFVFTPPEGTVINKF